MYILLGKQKKKYILPFVTKACVCPDKVLCLTRQSPVFDMTKACPCHVRRKTL